MEGLRPLGERRFRVGRPQGFPFRGAPFFMQGLDHSQHQTEQGEEDQNGQQR